jgi:hypothetical protein
VDIKNGTKATIATPAKSFDLALPIPAKPEFILLLKGEPKFPAMAIPLSFHPKGWAHNTGSYI